MASTTTYDLLRKIEQESSHLNWGRKMTFIVTPINKLPTSRSYRRYQEQMERDANREQVEWEAPNARTGDVVAFARNGKDVSFREIVNTNRNTNRHRIYLGPELQVWTWDLWMELGGKPIRRTTRLDNTRILSFLKHK